jgi:mannose-6-phosphate isomerase-like protein (cupin superfamily)
VQYVAWLAMMMVFVAGPDPQARPQTQTQTRPQTRPRTGPVTFAILVTDPAGAPISGVSVSVDGPVKREAITEAGRIALENLPTGAYHFTFQRDGFYVSEKDVNARGRAPIDVKVTMTPRPKPVPALRPPPPEEPPPANSSPVVLDLPAVIEKNYVGRAAGKTLSLACTPGGTSTLIQINQPIAEHTHADADEFVYVIAGAGIAHLAGRQEQLRAGFLLVVPRRMPHSFSVNGRNPLVMLSTRAGEKCAAER